MAERPLGSPTRAGVVADDQHHRVAEVLELPQLPEHHGVAEVDVRRRGVDARASPAAGGPSPSWRSSSPSGSASTALRVRNGRPRPADSVMAPMLESAALAGRPRRAVRPGDDRRRRMPETPTAHRAPSAAPRADRRALPRRERRRHPAVERRRARRRAKPKLKKLRLALVLLGLGVLALISTVFGMLMAVASDLPALENRARVQAARRTRCSTRPRLRPDDDRSARRSRS